MSAPGSNGLPGRVSDRRAQIEALLSALRALSRPGGTPADSGGPVLCWQDDEYVYIETNLRDEWEDMDLSIHDRRVFLQIQKAPDPIVLYEELGEGWIADSA